MLQNAHYSGNWNTDSWGSGMHDGGMMMGWGLHGFVSILFLTLIAIAIVLLIRWLWRGGAPATTTASGALDILEERYARGEIDQAEFQSRKKDIS